MLIIASEEVFEKTVIVVGSDRLETFEADCNAFRLGLFDAMSSAHALNLFTAVAEGW